MRFYEFSTHTRPVLKISQQAQASPNTSPTPLPQNIQPTPATAAPVKVYPRAWQRAWLQRYLAAKMAQSAQTIKPTADDVAIAYFKYGEAQSAADAAYERRTGKAAVDRRWVKRD